MLAFFNLFCCSPLKNYKDLVCYFTESFFCLRSMLLMLFITFFISFTVFFSSRIYLVLLKLFLFNFAFCWCIFFLISLCYPYYFGRSKNSNLLTFSSKRLFFVASFHCTVHVENTCTKFFEIIC